MTLVELQKILGDRVTIAMDDALQNEESAKENEKSEIIARMAKQMINNADIILRTDKLRAEGKLTNSAITKIVGD